MIRPEVLDAMVAAGCTAEQIAAAVKAALLADAVADEARLAAKRAANAERQRRHRNARNAESRVTERDSALPPHPPQKVSPEPPSKTSPRSGPKGPSLPPGECVGDAREIEVRKRIVGAYDAAGLLPPAMHLVGVWLARGYSPQLIEDVVCTGVRNEGIKSLAYFEKVLPKEHARMTAPEPRPPPHLSEPATVTTLNPRKRHDRKLSNLEIARSLIDRPPPGYS